MSDAQVRHASSAPSPRSAPPTTTASPSPDARGRRHDPPRRHLRRWSGIDMLVTTRAARSRIWNAVGSSGAITPRAAGGGRPAWRDRVAAAEELLGSVRAHGVQAVDSHPALERLGGLDSALGYLHGRWVTLLGTSIDDALEHGITPVPEVVWRAWRELVDTQPELAAVLAHHAGHPAVRHADTRHRRLLAAVSGVRATRLPGFSSGHAPDRAPATPTGSR